MSKAPTVELRRGSIFCACYPHPRFPTISITGNKCALNCKHCNGRYLKRMAPCPEPDALFITCLRMAKNGARGVLLSGGYNREGYVPFEPFLDAIERVKRETRLFVSAHTGLPPVWLAKELGRAEVDLADFDLIGDDETIKFAVGIDKKASDYLKTMKVLRRFLPEVVPHICIGLHGGNLKGEFRAVEMASQISPRMLVFLVFNPTRGTAFENLEPPSTEEVIRVINWAKERLLGAELALGCMRPKGKRRDELDLAAVNAGIGRIALPSKKILKMAEGSGIHMQRLNACCAVPLDVFGEEREG